ncbi:MAG TPA: GNAT family N-acetyltransferase [Burkholderiales bacterium]
MIAIRTVDTAEGLESLAAGWETLHAEAPVASVFTSWLWQYEWWKVYGQDQQLRVLVASEAGRTVGILPLYIQTSKVAGFPVRHLRLVGTGGDTYPDDLGPVLGGRSPGEVGRALAQAALRLRGWDILALADMDARLRFHEAAADEARQAGLSLREGTAERISFIDLPRSWDDYLKSASSTRRWRIRNRRRKLAALGQVRFFVWDDPATLDCAMDQLIALHRKRWDASGERGSFATRQYNDFHRAVMKGCLERGWLRLYCLEIAGRIVAIDYAYRFRNAVYFMQCGFDPELAQHAIGSVLLGYAVEHAIAEGNLVWDFLRGEHGYKEEWGTGVRHTMAVTVQRRGLAALMHDTRTVHLPALKAFARAVVGRGRDEGQGKGKLASPEIA